MHKVHLDTDLGGDIDDLCALAMLLRWPGIEITGITTVGEENGKRAGYVRYALDLEGRSAIPVAAGADMSGGYYPYHLGFPWEERYWPEPVASLPGDVGAALDLLTRSIEDGATVIGIGPYTNLYLLDLRYPGKLKQATLYLMGGHVFQPREGFPPWENYTDFNLQVDVRSAKHVIENSDATLVPLTVTVETALRRAYLEDLRKAGKLGALIARQAEEYEMDEQNSTHHRKTTERLPKDIINFLHDPLACAIALGWDERVEIVEVPLSLEVRDGELIERVSDGGKPTKIVTKVDGARFSDFWLERVTSND